MKQVTVLKENGDKAGEVSLPERWFAVEPNSSAVYYAVNGLLTNQRQGNAATKERGDLSYSTRKPWRQKGTGRARAGSRRSPLWRGGGTIFGPHPKDYVAGVPKKVRRIALVSALSAKAAEQGAIVVVENLDFDQPKTSRALAVLRNAGVADSRVLIMIDGYKPVLLKSVRNLPKVELKNFSECNAYDVLLADKLVIEKSVIEKLESTPDEGPVPDSEKTTAH
ncbi:MAG TPA: 50S ribosomal protein L4 [Candidatus Glassbacteria bacterium]|nr:50S ribosomal protein L4 [Candidatus Glassbacteria bacterium]